MNRLSVAISTIEEKMQDDQQNVILSKNEAEDILSILMDVYDSMNKIQGIGML